MFFISAFCLKNNLCNPFNALQGAVRLRSGQVFSLLPSTWKRNYSLSVAITLRSPSAHEMHLAFSLTEIFSHMLGCQLKGNLKPRLPLPLPHLISRFLRTRPLHRLFCLTSTWQSVKIVIHKNNSISLFVWNHHPFLCQPCSSSFSPIRSPM